MRFADRITFVTESDGGYDPGTGDHGDSKPEEVIKPCNLSELGIERTNELFGEIDKKIIVARTQWPYKGEIGHVKLNDSEQKYNVKRQSDYRKGVFFLEGVSHG